MSHFYGNAGVGSTSATLACDCLAHRFGNARDHGARERRYPTDMSDAEWAVVRPLLPVPGWLRGRGRGGQPEAYCHRAMLDAIRYLVDNGTKWRAMPADHGGDRAAAQVLLTQVTAAHHLLALVWADGGYTGSLVEYCLAALALVLAIVKRSDDMRGFVVLPKRWIVERFFAHLMRSRRLVRDFERSIANAEAMVYWSMTMLMTRRVARPRPSRA